MWCCALTGTQHRKDHGIYMLHTHTHIVGVQGRCTADIMYCTTGQKTHDGDATGNSGSGVYNGLTTVTGNMYHRAAVVWQ